MLLGLLLFLLFLYTVVSIAVVWFSKQVLFPLGNMNMNEEWFWTASVDFAEPVGLLLYLQGNGETPSASNLTISLFREQGWDVMAVGYTDNFDVTERDVLRAYEVNQKEYTETAIVARSIGSCIAPNLLKKMENPNKVKWVLYVTPVTSVSRLVRWHTWNVMAPVADMLHGAERGYSKHSTDHVHQVVAAKNDMITPYEELLSYTRGKNIQVHGLGGVGHNDIESSDEYVPLLQRLFLNQ
jgi:predicted alpha/beta hydrolase family esterase